LIEDDIGMTTMIRDRVCYVGDDSTCSPSFARDCTDWNLHVAKFKFVTQRLSNLAAQPILPMHKR